MVATESKLDALVRIGKALADPTRCRILLALLEGPAYPADLAAALDLSKSTISNHLSCARACGLVVGAPEGRRVRYELVDAALRHALNDLLEVVLVVEPGDHCLHDQRAGAVAEKVHA